MCSPFKTATITVVAIDRYHRQTLLPAIGAAGQQRLREARVLLIGCGALGSSIADQLIRAGIGFLRIVDRDIVELTNLHRQTLFTERDVEQGAPKAVAAADRLRQVNSDVTVEPVVSDVDSGNVEALLRNTGSQPVPQASRGLKERDPIDLILDGTDNVATRYLINDVAVKHSIPWIYGACVGTEGRVMTVLPGQTPCLRCIFPQPPGAGELPTCDTAGVLGPVAAVVGSIQALNAIKLLSGNAGALAEELLTLDLWTNRIRSINISQSRRANCLTCGQHRFEFLDAAPPDSAAKLCGRDAMQIRWRRERVELKELAQRLAGAGAVDQTPFLVRCTLSEGGLRLTAFADGRILVHGTADPARARSVVAKYLGS
jgi:adenylyltransferase/sulfurtransferase